ncbi:hypothetical protein CIT292_07238 [Citrobacter youngae ATCC 29220]|uniref:Uncharacterized protein n=1 Tax=Citrobacter youngae ATCC 29220 TaxID=500640 RepID=D4B9U8_9ENTR|nr:hypothetical protein CIT292_07238 [Citrobacter youngae ATCC 29220]
MALNHVLPLRLSELSAFAGYLKGIIPVCGRIHPCFANFIINTVFWR